MSFESLGLSAPVLQAVADKGYTEPTPIQEKAIPIVLMGRDVLGCAQTGTGKTASFVLPMIDILSEGRAKSRMPRTLILEPTRELAAQVAENFEIYGKNHKLNMALLIGGVSFPDQERALERGADVLIATPGRLLDHFERGGILLNDVKILVIDEADRMLDMGFIPDVERIVGLLSPMRQTLFFSATMPPEIRRLADRFLSNPKEVTRVAAGLGRHQHRPGPGRRAGSRQARGAARPDQEPGRQERPRVLQPQARRGDAARLAEEARLQCRRAARRHEPAGAHGDARALQAGRDPDPGGVRRRRPRPRHRRHEPRLQFRRAVLARGLRPSHRPHRPRRQDRPLLHPGVALRRRSRPGDREADRHHHSPHRGAGPGCRRLRGLGRSPPRTRSWPWWPQLGDKPRGPRREAKEPREHHERQPRPPAEPHAEARAEQHEPREHAPREHAPREHAPREHRPREHKPREHGPREHGPREQRAEQHRPQRERKPDQRPERRERRHDGRDEPAPVGLGDHVPAFLARSPR